MGSEMCIRDRCKKENTQGVGSVQLFDELMESLNNDDNFLVED